MKGKNRRKLEKPRLPKIKDISASPKKGEEKSEKVVRDSGEKEGKPGEGELNFFQLTGILCLIFAVCGLLLGLVDSLTAQRIAENESGRNMGVLEEVLLYGGDYREIRYTGTDPTVEAVYEAPEVGWVIQVSPADSYSGTLTLMVGVDVDGRVTGVAVTDSGESDGLGLRASEPEFREQFVGKMRQVRVEADGGEIAAISGATVTSRAVCRAVNSALTVAGLLG